MYDLIIVGGGVAAFSAALYSARRGLKVLVLGKDLGGQANSTDLIENFPGLDEVGGYELVSKIKRQAEKFGTQTLIAQVSAIKTGGSGFVITAYGKQYKSQAVVLAFGKTPRDLKVPGEEEFKGKGVSYCATCDAPLFKNKTVAVAGLGDLNLEAALLCAKFAKKVYLLSKNDTLVGHPALIKAVSKKSNIEILPFTRIDSIEGKEKISALELTDLRHNHRQKIAVDGLFVELGYIVDSGFVKDLVELDELGQIKIKADQSTSHPGIFAAGDATNRPYKQAVISAGEGAAAALSAYDWLMRKQGGTGLTSDWTQIKRVK